MLSQKPLVRFMARSAALGVGLAAGAYAGSVATAWLWYGRVRSAPGEAGDGLLDRFMPAYEIIERHQIHVAAPADVTFSAACDLDLQQSRPIVALFKIREAILGSAPDRSIRPRGLVRWTKTLGWAMLAEVPGREIVMGCVTRPWDSNVVFRALPPDQFAAFREPSYVKIAWTIRADSLKSGGSMARTETRAVATDPIARRRFRRYWSFFSPGIILIRHVALRLLKEDAERRARY
jgi:hypothetical protein